MKKERKKQEKNKGKKGKNCGLAYVLVTVILLGAVLQNENLEANASEESVSSDSLEEALSENSIVLKLFDEEQLVQEEKIAKGSISCNLISLEKTGYIFEGYIYEDRKVLDAAGAFTQEFMELVQWEQPGAELVLTSLWIPKTYRVYYGKDEDQDGLPDGQMQVTYGESYENLTPLPDRGLSVFKGYYFGRKQVFNRKGKAKESWIWDSEEDIVLKAKYYRPEGNDLFGDSNDSDGESAEKNSQETAAENQDGHNSPENLENQDSSGNQAVQENNSSESLGSNGNVSDNSSNSVSDNSYNSASDNEVNKALDNAEKNGGDPDKIISDKGVSENQAATENNTLYPQAEEREEIEKIPENNTENHIADALQNTTHNTAKNISENTPESGKQTVQKNIRGGISQNSAENKKTAPDNTKQNSLQHSREENKDNTYFPDAYRRWKSETESFLEERGIPKEVLTISVYMVTSSILLAALLLSFYLLQNSAVLYTNDLQGKRKRIAFILLQRKQEGYQFSISRKQLDESETGNYILILPGHMVRSKKNERLIISIPNKKWCELPAKEISFLA